MRKREGRGERHPLPREVYEMKEGWRMVVKRASDRRLRRSSSTTWLSLSNSGVDVLS